MGAGGIATSPSIRWPSISRPAGTLRICSQRLITLHIDIRNCRKVQWALCLSSAFSLLHINDTQRQSCICRICVIELPRHAQTLSLSHTLPFSWGHLFGVFPLSFTGCHIKVRGRSDGREKRANRYEILPYCTNDKLRRAAHVIFMPFPFVGSLFFYPSSTCIDAPSSTETWLLNRLFGCIAIKGGSKSREAFQSINGSF